MFASGTGEDELLVTVPVIEPPWAKDVVEIEVADPAVTETGELAYSWPI